VFLFVGAIEAQVLQAPDVNQMCVRAVQLMDAGGVAIPGLRTAAAPLIGNLSDACRELQLRPATGQPSYNVLQTLRAYLDLSDAVPKPYPFPDAARDQLRELRDAMTRFEAHFRALLDQKDVDLRSPDRDQVSRFTQDNSVLAPAAARRVVFLGDSILSQWRLNEYFPQEDFVNRAITGQLSGQLLTRMRTDVVELKPAAVVIEAGSFDVARGVPLELIAANIQAMADIAVANNIKVIVAAVTPVNDDRKNENPTYERTPARPPDRIAKLNAWLKDFATRRKLGYVDFYATLVDSRGLLQAEASDDGLHPNARGYRLMAPVLAAEIDRTLRPPTPPRPPAVAKPSPKK
jgi:lysophospholipase L1-like esterase